MRSFLWCLVGRLLALIHVRGGGTGAAVALLFLVAILVGGSAGGASAVETQQRYSAYSDPEKPAISFVLSDDQNVEEFQTEFALSDKNLETVLAAIRKENEALARAQSESQRVVGSSKGLSKEQVKGKIEASGYDKRVREAIARTKTTVERVLPTARRQEFKQWVDAKWLQASQQLDNEPAAAYQVTASSGMWFKVYATQYNGYTTYEVALPYRNLKYNGGYRVYLDRNNRGAWAPVKEVGPWNTYDNWWAKPSNRVMWKNLSRGVPEAQAAYYSNYNRGRDEFGRKVLNPAGVDLTPAAAAKLGLRKYQNAWIWVYIPWVSP